ncbi:glycosyl transferase family 28 [Ruania suaedae]|uniref:glycosyltransferase family protein n=1 Tax=Ruania suaedae TaxID=2897774 RepID=UPI001E417986|nr:glycosyltransferase [Ruania suaedae]UFU03787.1 glycosyl transferase family 28 [Ruania suaedae]
MGTQRSGRRVALYSHDTQGLGHIRRNIEIAAALATAEPDTDVLLLTGAPEATALALPPRTEVLTLPAVGKDAEGRYAARTFALDLPELLHMRSKVIWAAVRTFAPDLLVVDKVPRGLGGELERTLRKLATNPRRRTRTVLGLRDVLDTPAIARREWHEQESTAAVTGWYDQVWIYGDPRIYDPVLEYGLPPGVARRSRFTGYLAQGRGSGLQAPDNSRTTRPRIPDASVLCLVGGGQDGADLARAFVRAPMPEGYRGVLVTGPYLPAPARAEIERLAANRPVTVHSFVANLADLIAHAGAIVSMGGYNTVCELLSSRRPTLLVPRERPRAEQAVRAQRLRRAGAVDVLAPAAADPLALGDWLAGAVRDDARPRGASIDLDGLARIPDLAHDLLITPELTDVSA